MTETWLKKNLNRETEFLFISAQNNAIRNNCIEIDNKQKNRKCRLCVNREETVNQI